MSAVCAPSAVGVQFGKVNNVGRRSGTCSTKTSNKNSRTLTITAAWRYLDGFGTKVQTWSQGAADAQFVYAADTVTVNATGYLKETGRYSLERGKPAAPAQSFYFNIIIIVCMFRLLYNIRFHFVQA